MTILKQTNNKQIFYFRLFKAHPDAKILFGFDDDDDPDSDSMINNKEFIRNASYMIQMFDTVFNMLGPDVELLSEILQDVAIKHQKFGVTPTMFHEMEHCLINTLQEILGPKKFSSSMKQAYHETYAALSSDMIVSKK
jgi:hemoglobin-like flavoprotein